MTLKQLNHLRSMYLSRPHEEISGVAQYASRARQVAYLLDMHHHHVIDLESDTRFLLKRALNRMDEVVREHKKGKRYDLNEPTQALFYLAISIVRIYTDGKLNSP